ncbi:cytochrome c3 family protein [Geobacter sp. DSM 9736]|uniref:cytochrome c3 family protein n=1 Tax=Geobacter sp. DSM 9736 TaxID=1277350 RepID=UPI000B50F2BD|nr:cytochrome c3 family protein [Geobacter sp. DSM 9736]SNB47295.1 doubled CXXCH domain-containing protein [Geobacter sp. DSM 9736]
MKGALFLCSAILSHLLLSVLPAEADLATGKPCYQCHVSKTLGAHLHGPVNEKECEPCHNSGGGNHFKSKGLFGPKAKGSALCYGCHENLSLQKSVHGPIRNGYCSGCHAPHSSPYGKLLLKEGSELCFNCHDKGITRGIYSHEPVASGECLGCHVPHQSTQTRLLKPAESGICLTCHDKSIASGVSVHPPVASGGCASCHAVHGGDNPKLLKISGASGTASFCYECHDNLSREKSVHAPVAQGECGACHLPHSAPARKLLRAAGSSLCFTCHDRSSFSKKIGHGPVSSGNCLDCHTAHHSKIEKLLKPSNGPICFDCHKKVLTAGKSVHAPVASGECGRCHEVHGSEREGLLKAIPSENSAVLATFCYSCHDNLATDKVVHLPVKEGSCTACHAAHSSQAGKLLTAEGSALCFGCHNKARFSRKIGHEPVESGNCLSCHEPHQSKRGRLLKGAEDSLACFDCHDRSIGTGTSIHSPVASGDCGGCHSVHGSDYPKLLIADYPDKMQIPYSDSAYAFCFTCHDSRGITEKETTATDFRDGKINLHLEHVRGHSCRVCHDVHSASQPKLIRPRTIGIEGVEYTVKFQKTPEGGSCKASCHDTMSYKR